MQRQCWTNNGHVEVDWSRVQVGDVIDHVPVAVKACPVRFGPPVWHALVVVPNSESATVDRLKDASMRTYWPKVYKWAPTKEYLANGQRRMEKVARPMFPGYLFTDLRAGLDDFRAVLKVKGIRDFLRRNGEPCVLPSGLYDAIVKREREKSGEVDEQRFNPFKIGQAVRVLDGAFRDFVTKVEGMDDRGRVCALLDMFGQKTRTYFEAAQLEKV